MAAEKVSVEFVRGFAFGVAITEVRRATCVEILREMMSRPDMLTGWNEEIRSALEAEIEKIANGG